MCLRQSCSPISSSQLGEPHRSAIVAGMFCSTSMISGREQLVASFGGQVVKHTGDGMLATFDGPARGAVRGGPSRRMAGAGVPIRAGLHPGQVERRHDDHGGIAVHIAARVVALAKEGEVLASCTVRDLVVGSDLDFEDRGAHELKGVPEDWQIYAAC